MNDRRLNNLEVSYFTVKLGELLMSDGRVVNTYSYDKGTENLPASKECVGLRKWTDSRFHEVTLQYSKAWTPEKVYDELVQVFGESLFKYGPGVLGSSTTYEGKVGTYSVSSVLGICTDLYVAEAGAIKSNKSVPYETFSDKDFDDLVAAIKKLEDT